MLLGRHSQVCEVCSLGDHGLTREWVHREREPERVDVEVEDVFASPVEPDPPGMHVVAAGSQECLRRHLRDRLHPRVREIFVVREAPRLKIVGGNDDSDDDEHYSEQDRGHPQNRTEGDEHALTDCVN